MKDRNQDMDTTGRDLVPAQHVSEPKGLGRLFHPSSFRRTTMGTNLAIGAGGGMASGFVATMLIESVLVPLNMGIPGIPLLIASSLALMPPAYGIAAWRQTSTDDDAAMSRFTTMAEDAIRGAMWDGRIEGNRILKEKSRTLVNSTDAASSGLRRRTVIRIASIQQAFQKSLGRLGTASKDEAVRLRDEAIRAVATEAVREHEAFLQEMRDRDARGAGGAIDMLRDEIGGLLSIGSNSSNPIMIPHVGTGRAHVDRLISKAEEALAIDPNMTDRQGARVDAAIHEHLPRLLQRHADTAKQARVEDLAETDRMLDEGVELIRLSVEEGLEGLRHEKADALRTEIGFLRLRRAGSDGPLRPIDRSEGA
jgi:hypothetical protein